MRRLILAIATAAALLATLLVAPASATYIGREGKLAFVRANQIYTVANAGGAVKKLTASGKNYRPKWAPDGKRIAYIHQPSATVRELWLMKADGSAKSRVTVGGNVTAGPTWSPDGQWLAYANSDQYLTKINTTAPYGTPALVLGYPVGDSQGPCDCPTPGPVHVNQTLAWSPDGSRIAVNDAFVDGQFDHTIYLLNVLTGAADLLLVTGADCCGYATFTDFAYGPTGQLGVSESWDEGFIDAEVSHLIDVIVYPTDQCHIWIGLCTAPSPPGPVFTSVVGDKSPAPSPLNTHMAFVNASSGTSKIFVSTITGADRKVVVTRGYQPDWQPLP